MNPPAIIGNAVLVFVTFLVSIPAMVLPMTRGWLKFHGYMTVVCALFTMILGLLVWFETLQTRGRLATIFTNSPALTQSLIQQEARCSSANFRVLEFANMQWQFQCCGFANSTSSGFVVDSQCPSALAAANQIGCVGPFSTYANNFLDLIFTAAFGIVGMCTSSLSCPPADYGWMQVSTPFSSSPSRW
jgi:hypothetical protein